MSEITILKTKKASIKQKVTKADDIPVGTIFTGKLGNNEGKLWVKALTDFTEHGAATYRIYNLDVTGFVDFWISPEFTEYIPVDLEINIKEI